MKTAMVPLDSQFSPLSRQLMSTLTLDSIEDEADLDVIMTPGGATSPRSILRAVTDAPVFSEEKLHKNERKIRRHLTFESRKSLFNNKRRPESPEYSCNKRRRSENLTAFTFSPIKPRTVQLDNGSLDNVLERDGLTGDGAATLSLPTIPGKHRDLNNIDKATLVDLMNGKYSETIRSHRIIDCRYPYEFEAGHIRGAENIFSEDGILELLCLRSSDDLMPKGNKRDILIFHCEFSSERGPKRCRFLRNQDRKLNKENYPFLNFPEIYILHGGYKDFFADHVNLCEPQDYKPMLHEDHGNDLKFFRKKSKSWSAGEKRKFVQKSLRF